MQKCEYKLYNHTLILPLHGQHDHPKLYTKKTLTVWQSRGASDHMPKRLQIKHKAMLWGPLKLGPRRRVVWL